jgi:antimicrobial peptide system SdpA family protein
MKLKYPATFIYLSNALCCALLLFYLLVTSMPFNPIRARNPVLKRSGINSMIPEGWGFFTRPAREPRVVLYDAQLKRVVYNTAAASVFFGLSRYHRALGGKISTIAEELKKDSTVWMKIPGPPDNSVQSLIENTVTLSNSHLSGIHYIQLIDPLPWSWVGLKDQWDIPSSVCKINILCKQ